MKEIDLNALGKLAMKDSKKKTFVRFYNSKEDVFITIPMNYEPFDPDLHQKGEIGVDQRIEAYEKLSHYVTDEFMHNTAVYEAIVADKDNKIYEVVKNNVYEDSKVKLKEKIDALNGDHGFLFDEDMSEGCINFYYREMIENDQDLIDADDYAMLNSILRYDIGRETAHELSRELWEQDVDVMELDSDLKSKILIQEAAERCSINLDWLKWIEGALDAFKYFPE